MKQYRTAGIVEIGSGEIGLSEAQASPRLHKLASLGKGKYRIMAPVEFKAGEVIGLTEIPKGIASRLEEILAQRKEQAERK